MRPVLQRRRPRPDSGPDHAGAVEAPDLTGRPLVILAPVPAASRACCCSAAPVYQVVLPSPDGGPRSAELLLCGHHYRLHRRQLQARSAASYDGSGWPVDVPA